MSLVTNVIVSCDGEYEGVKELTKPCDWSDMCQGQALAQIAGCDYKTEVKDEKRPDDFWGGSKFPEVDLFAAAYNYLDRTAMLRWLLSLPWSDPESVQVFIKGQDSERFDVYHLRDGISGRFWVQLVESTEPVDLETP